jgi:uracil-DNA glycosylase
VTTATVPGEWTAHGRAPNVPSAVGRLVADVSSLDVAGALNLYDESDSMAWGDPAGAATARKKALITYLAGHWSAPVVLVGEAPGKHGARWTGVPFTSPRLLEGSGPSEPTATVVHRVLAELGCESEVLLWNASMLFPPGNRDPRRAELSACAPALAQVCRGRTVLAVGRHAERATGAPYVRHPSHGGAAFFAEGVRRALHRPPGAGLPSGPEEVP